MGFLAVHPDYAELLHGQGLARADDFLALPGVILGGHPDRHVARVMIDSGTEALTAFLKRQHRIPLGERLRNKVAGFGAVSKSRRELAALRELAGLGAPDWMAVGESADGRAFLLIREVPDSVELRTLLLENTLCPGDRRRLPRSLGRLLARLHASGFDHPDLYAKHVRVRRGDLAVTILDWQRTRRWPRVPWRLRARDLSALDATLGDHLVSPRERLTCLAAYLREASASGVARPSLSRFAATIARRTRRRLRRRRVRDMRAFRSAKAAPTLVWLDGEALCVTGEVHRALGDCVPAWLGSIYDACEQAGACCRSVIVAGRPATLRQRRLTRTASVTTRLLRRAMSPEFRELRALFRLQECGIEAPAPLAAGQRRRFLRVESFLITEAAAGIPLRDWLEKADARGDDACRDAVLREAAELTKRIQEAGCRLARRHSVSFAVIEPAGAPPRVVLAGTQGLWIGRPPRGLARRREREQWRLVAGEATSGGHRPDAYQTSAGESKPVAELCAGRA